MVSIKILGSGCTNCKRLAELAQKAVNSLSVKAEITKVTDYAEIMEYDLLSTPGLVVNEKVVSSGRVPSEAEIVTLLADSLS